MTHCVGTSTPSCQIYYHVFNLYWLVAHFGDSIIVEDSGVALVLHRSLKV